jgi:translation initiation factor IF-3
VRVIDSAGAQLGVITIEEALRLAQQKELDLVEVAPTANPPVCRIMDYGKFRYAQKKKAQESRKKGASGSAGVKEVKVGSQTSVHDVDFKVGHIRKFLGEGQRVKVSVFFRGRAITHPELGHVMLKKIADMVADVAVVEQQPRLEGRSMSMMLVTK